MTSERRSRFSDDLDPADPLPEYPRPQLRRPHWRNLNGWWELAIQPLEAPPPTTYADRVLVPFPIGSALSGVERTVQPDERAWMRCRFDLERPVAGRRVLLHFGAVDWECTIWCDGVEVGGHRGGYDPFHVDITDALTDTADHEVVVSVWDPSDEGAQPVGKQTLSPIAIWYPALCGIWQTVWLEEVSSARIEAVSTTTSLETDTVAVSVQIHGADDGDRLRLVVRAADEVVATADAQVEGAATRCDLTVRPLRRWSPDDPFLHDLDVALVREGRDVDAVESYFGAREVGVVVDGDGVRRLALNGATVFHLGLLDQGWWPDGLSTPPTDEALAFDIEATKAMGFNTIRKHVKVEPARWYWHADRLGVLVWQDMPSTAVDRAEMGRQIAAGNDLAEGDWSVLAPARDPVGFRAELNAMLDALMPFPSIVCWVPFNEGWGQHDTEATLAHVAARDPSRLVDGPSGWVDGGEGDIRDHHTYHSESEFPGLDPSRPVVYGEYGGYTLAVDGHTSDAMRFGYGECESTDELAERYEALMTTIAGLVDRGLAGAIYTQTTDVEGEINGLLTYDREVQKLPTDLLRRLHEAVIEGRRP